MGLWHLPRGCRNVNQLKASNLLTGSRLMDCSIWKTKAAFMQTNIPETKSSKKNVKSHICIKPLQFIPFVHAKGVFFLHYLHACFCVNAA